MRWPSLPRAADPLFVRSAADSAQITLQNENEVRQTIVKIAVKVYQNEKSTNFWHGNVCMSVSPPPAAHPRNILGIRSPAPKDNLPSPKLLGGDNERYQQSWLRFCLCFVHDVRDTYAKPKPGHSASSSISSEVSNASDSSNGSQDSHRFDHCHYNVTPATCKWSASNEKPCNLPSFDSNSRTHLAYFECLYYVTVVKVKELYDELLLRLGEGFHQPDYLLHTSGISDESRLPCTIRNLLMDLTESWKVLNSPGLVATLDTAVRLRNMNDCCVASKRNSEDAPATDVNIRRRQLFVQDQAADNARFMDAKGLVNLNNMSPAMTCASVKSLHKAAMRSKRKILTRMIDERREVREQASIVIQRQYTQDILEGRTTSRIDSALNDDDAQPDDFTVSKHVSLESVEPLQHLMCKNVTPETFKPSRPAAISHGFPDFSEYRHVASTPVQDATTRLAADYMLGVPKSQPTRRYGGRDPYALALYEDHRSPGRYNTTAMQPPAAGPESESPEQSAPTDTDAGAAEHSEGNVETTEDPEMRAPIQQVTPSKPRAARKPLVRSFSDWSLDSKESRFIFVPAGPGGAFEERPIYAAPKRLVSQEGTFSMKREDLMAMLPERNVPLPATPMSGNGQERQRSASSGGRSGKTLSWLSFGGGGGGGGSGKRERQHSEGSASLASVTPSTSFGSSGAAAAGGSNGGFRAKLAKIMGKE